MMCLDPNLIVQDKEACSTKFKVVMKKLVEFKRLTMRNFTPYLWSNLSWWTELLRLPLSSLTLRQDRLDVFLKRHMGCASSLSKLCELVRKLLTLCDWQASVERGFPVICQVMMDNMKEQTFIGQRTIHNHILSIGGLRVNFFPCILSHVKYFHLCETIWSCMWNLKFTCIIDAMHVKFFTCMWTLLGM